MLVDVGVCVFSVCNFEKLGIDSRDRAKGCMTVNYCTLQK